MLERFIPWGRKERPGATRQWRPPDTTGEPDIDEEARHVSAFERAQRRSDLHRAFASIHETSPETPYMAPRREDAARDLLLGEIALDSLERHTTHETVVRIIVNRDDERRRYQTEHVFPKSLFIAGKRLEVGELLGKGGMGTVVEAGPYVIKFIPVLGQTSKNQTLSYAAREISAMAMFNPLPDADAGLLNALRLARTHSREARTTDRIPGFLGATRVLVTSQERKEEEYIAIAMERVQGENLDEAIHTDATYESVTPDTYVNITRQIAQALSAFHEVRILHRDVKPSNIMVSFPQLGLVEAKLTDMGIAMDWDYHQLLMRGELSVAVHTLREQLLELSYINQFAPKAEEAWLELAALLDRVESGEERMGVALDERVDRLVKKLPPMAKFPVERETMKAREQAPHIVGTVFFLDFDARKGRPTTASDVYALGISVGELLAVAVERRYGRNLSAMQGHVLLANSGFFEREDVVTELGGGERGRKMAALLRSMIEKDQENRPKDAVAVLKALEQMG